MKTPRLYLGTMTFGWTTQTSSIVDETVAIEMVRSFVTKENQQQQQQYQPSSELKNDRMNTYHHIDTARIYAGGHTESIVSHALKHQDTTTSGMTSHFMVGTKAHPSQPGGLSSIGITQQIQTSFAAMPNISSFDEYYLHQPDPNNALLDSLQCLHQFHQQGLISSIGMSNYHASEMEHAFDLCIKHNLTPPTVYQGLYNPLNRMIEHELLPILRKNKCSFVAYNPLAGGLLTGKYQLDNTIVVPHGRFKDNPNYLPRFYTDSNFEAVSIISKACTDANISMVEATYLWLMYHSALTENDGILIGASSVNQLQENLNILCSEKERLLPDSVLDAFEEGWNITNRGGVFPYWRSYSADMPNREQRDQGASYDAIKKTTQ
jgi:aflatoxin B1 aldehyde reductase